MGSEMCIRDSGRLVLTTEVIGYCLMGTLILIEVVRTVAFWLMDEKGL